MRKKKQVEKTLKKQIQKGISTRSQSSPLLCPEPKWEQRHSDPTLSPTTVASEQK